MASSDFEIDLGLSSEGKEIAQNELRESDEIVEAAKEALQKLIDDDKTVGFPNDPNYLQIFLRPCKYYPESAYKLVNKGL